MKNRTIVLQPPRQHQSAYTPDPVLDSAIAAHQRRLNARLAMIAGNPHARAALARHLNHRMTNHRGFRS